MPSGRQARDGQGGPEAVSGTRRALLLGAGAVGASAVLAACGADERGTGTTRSAPTAGTTAPATGTEGAANVLAKVGDVPVGGGRIFAERGVVVTQPSEGVFKGFSAICTHQQCPLANVDGGTINCTCHGSKFSIDDGRATNGPATRPLPAKAVHVDGENVILA